MIPEFSWLPSVDSLILDLKKEQAESPHDLLATVSRQAVEEFRKQIAKAECSYQNQQDLTSAVFNKALDLLGLYTTAPKRALINATGIIIHTNLGRAPLSKKAQKAVMAAAGYCNLEFDLESGKRAGRYDYLRELFIKLSGAEDCLVVNNNAAAILLVLDSLAKNKEVLISRGELVEIGGSFRIPDIIEKSGCYLREVGSTNKTHLPDYEQRINSETALIMRAHTSNFVIEGFAEKPSAADLASLAHAKGLIFVNDIGSGCLYPLAQTGIGDEPLISEEIKNGCDVLTLSGDKLLGGPQAGIILGRKSLLSKMKDNPLYRALRIDKLSLAALEGTMLSYLDLNMSKEDIPVLQMLLQAEEQIKKQGQRLCRLVGGTKNLSLQMEKGLAVVGGGALPGVSLATYLIKASVKGLSSLELAYTLRQKGIIPYIHQEQVTLNLRTVKNEEIAQIAAALKAIAAKIPGTDKSRA